MLKKIGMLVVISSFLSACSYFNMNNNKTEDQYARCKELKRQIIFNSSDNDGFMSAPQGAVQRNAELDTLNRSYRDDGCT